MHRPSTLVTIPLLLLGILVVVLPCTVRAGSLVTQEVAKLVPAGLDASDELGNAVDVWGDTVVVGAPLDDDLGADAGAVYVFRRNAGGADGWDMVAKITASDGVAGDRFGTGVAIWGDMVVVGAFGDDDAGLTSGSAYVFARNEGGAEAWGEVAKLTASDADAGDNFGFSVDISGETVLVGALGNDDAGSNSGSAYVFERNSGGADAWGEVTKLTAFDADAADLFGRSVALSGGTAVVGALLDDDNGAESGSAYVFARNEGGAGMWGQVTKVLASDGAVGDSFGFSVAIAGDTVVIGANADDDAGAESGSAYVFTRNQGGADLWGEMAKLTASDAAAGDEFGRSVAVDGAVVLVGARWDDDHGSASGSAYLFERNRSGADSWGQVQKLLASDGAAGDEVGRSVALDGETLVLGAPLDDTSASDTGSAYVFRRDGSRHLELHKRIGSDVEAGDAFGNIVALDGDVLYAAAHGDDDLGTDAGAGYLFLRNHDPATPGTPVADHWGELKKLTASDGTSGDLFGMGNREMIQGDILILNSRHADHSSFTDAGASYVFERNFDPANPTVPVADNWGERKKLVASDPGAGDQFGIHSAHDGHTAVLGSDRDDNANGTDAGAAYVFDRNAGGGDNWGERKKLLASDGAAGDHFGGGTDMSGDTIVIGALGDDGARGAMYVFERNLDPANPSVPLADNWGERKKVVAADGDAGDGFGLSTDLEGDVLVVGSRFEDEGGLDAGAAYVFYRNQGGADNWGQVEKLMASDAAADDRFGTWVSIEGDRIYVSSPFDDDDATDAGSFYVFERNAGGPDNWGEIGKIVNPDPDIDDQFSRFGLATSGPFVIAGLARDDEAGTDAGAVHVFEFSAPESDLAVTKTNGQTETVPGTTTTYTITVTNAGPEDVTGATVTDTFDGTRMDESNVSWTCAPSAGSGAGTDCPASGVGADLVAGVSVDVEAGDSVVFIVDVPVFPSATGTLVNTAAVAVPSATLDPGTDNEATDSDTLTPEVDLAVAKDDGRDFAEIGGSLTYTILVSNSAGPSDAPGTTVTDTFPAELTCTWSCAGAGGGTCGAGSGSGDLGETVDLPVGGSVTYTVDCAIDAGATAGTITNTAIATPAAGVTDDDPLNDSGSDSTELTTCGEPNDLILESQTISTTETFTACQTITAGSGFVVDGTGDVTLRAGATVILGDDFSVEAGGGLAVEIDPTLGN